MLSVYFHILTHKKKSRLGAPQENLAVEWAIHSRVSDVRVNHGREVLSPPSRRGSKARKMRNAIYRPMRLIFSQVQAKKANKDSEIWLSSRKTNRNKYSHGRELFVPRKSDGKHLSGAVQMHSSLAHNTLIRDSHTHSTLCACFAKLPLALCETTKVNEFDYLTKINTRESMYERIDRRRSDMSLLARLNLIRAVC